MLIMRQSHPRDDVLDEMRARDLSLNDVILTISKTDRGLEHDIF